jgi:hypothetical protein
MGMDPMNRAAQPDSMPATSDPAGVQGVCAQCGRPLSPPDLEAVAVDIDRTLSMESGRLVARSEWAGAAPDGLLEGLMGWLPSVKAKRAAWNRGQALWAEHMTRALSGPCDDCLAAGVQPGAAPVMPSPAETAMMDPSMAARAAQPDYHPEAATSAMYSPPAGAVPASTDMLEAPTPAFGSAKAPTQDPHEDMPTGAVESPFMAGQSQVEDEPTELPTMAVDSASFREAPPTAPPAREQAPAPPGDEEYEAHTVMIPALQPRAGGPRLAVIDGPVHGHQFSVERQTTTIGRSIGCHITIDAENVGYDHARVVRAPDGWRLEVVGGSEDTFVNDEPVSTTHSLRSGDVIRIGPARLRFEAAG